MLELPMASLLTHEPPSVALKQLQNLANFHAASMPQRATRCLTPSRLHSEAWHGSVVRKMAIG
jgi:hypothetical protein